jgi:hypothetical protein
MTMARGIRLLTVALAITGVLVLGLQSGLADQNLPDIGKHRHYVVTESGQQVEVGPDLCGNPKLQQAFNQFHSNVHAHVLDSNGQLPSAPGLHNLKGGEIIAGRC